jgi:hypothetical protein
VGCLAEAEACDLKIMQLRGLFAVAGAGTVNSEKKFYCN